MIEDILPKKVFMIKDLDTLRVVADPLRAQILEVLISQSSTVREVAGKLGLSSSKLYYHVSLLEKHGLIAVVETRQIGNLLEKVYRAAARELDVEKSLLNFSTDTGKETANALVLAALDTTRDDLLRSLQARTYELEHGAVERPRRVIINRILSQLTDQQADKLQARMVALLKEFEGADQGDATPNTHPYALVVAFYPTFYYPGGQIE